MPLVRFQVSNEYGLGQPNLYAGVNNRGEEDPKQLLDGLAVAGLVGILRQLGDLAEFAAEIFHGIQDQVMTTASRSHKLMVRVHNIEARLPPLERAILAQNSHIHFAYTAGSEWHPRIKNEQNHFIYNDLPRFIMDSYEECPDPPRLQLLDKFDTGGPGSCLKRYSDPTFFRRASSSVIDADAEKAQKDKKVRKNKKKRTSRRNGQSFRDAPISNQSARFHFASSIVNGSDSPSQTASMGDMTMKPDMENLSHSRSFDSRSGSGYIECVLDTNSPLQSEEQNSNEPSTGSIQNTRTPDFVFPDEEARLLVDDTFSHSSLQEQCARDSSCVTWEQEKVPEDNFSSHEDAAGNSYSVTWDEKAEIVEPKDQNCVEMFPMNFNMGSRAVEPVNLSVVEQNNIPFGVGRNQVEETESEPETFVDALNTIESESETDLEIQTKTDVDRYFTTSKTNNRTEDDIQQCMPNSSENHPSGVHSEAFSGVYPGEEMSSNLQDLVSFGSVPSEPTPEIPSIKIDKAEGGMEQFETNCLDNHPQTVVSSDNGTSSNFLDSVPLSCLAYEQNPFIKTDETEDGNHQPVENSLGDDPPVVESLNASIISSNNKTSCNFSSPLPSQSLSDEQVAKTSDLDNSPDSKCRKSNNVYDGFRVDPVTSGQSFSGSTIPNVQDLPRDSTSSSSFEFQEPHADSFRVPSVTIWTNGGLLGLQPSKPPVFSASNAKSQDFVTNGEDETSKKAENDGGGKLATHLNSHHGDIINDTNLVPPPPTTELPVTSDVKRESDENSSGVFGLGHRLLRKVSLVHDGRSQPPNTNGGNSEYQTISEAVFNDMFGHGSPLHSRSSSPPLEHMKIAFNPINGSETSKLKLKFPDGSHNYHQQSNRDMFPSFQLVPNPTTRLHDNHSDSDDDTFCRSSPYMSDDCLSHESDSDSEQWESGELIASNDMSNALCIMSSEYFSASAQLGTRNTENGADSSLCSPLLDLPSFDAILQGDRRNDLNLRNLFSGQQNCAEPTPIPPPLPPVQWRVLKSPSDELEHDQSAESEALNQRLAQSPVPRNYPNEEVVNFEPETEQQDQLKLNRQIESGVVENGKGFEEKDDFLQQIRTKQQDQLMLNRQIESGVAENGKGFDEKDDFLQQIRSKSFNLRPTFALRPTATSGPATNVKITAILEKASAIRQAVASDSEDVDNWSDS